MSSDPLLFSAHSQPTPHCLVNLGAGTWGVIVDGEVWLTAPQFLTGQMIESAHRHGRSAIMGNGQTFFQASLFRLEFPDQRKFFRKIERRIRAAIWDQSEHGRN
jgi:hypothetical protein